MLDTAMGKHEGELSGRNNTGQGGTDTDADLLRRYVRRGCQGAFAQITARYSGMVYAVCLRELHDRERAEDAAQTVFILLARKSAALQNRQTVAGWLFTAAQLVSRNLRRQEERRQQQEEKIAQLMMQQGRESQNGADMTRTQTGNVLWDAVEPHLNSAFRCLRPADQDALLIRYFENQTLAETGARLGVSENTARMRVSRAVERLRTHLRKAGVTVPLALLPLLLVERASHAVPETLATTLAQTVPTLVTTLPASVGVTIAGARLASYWKGTLLIMAVESSKKGIIVAGIALLALLGGGAVLVKVAPGAVPGFSHTDPVAERIATVMAGEWESVDDSVNPATGQVQRVPGKMTMNRIPNGFEITSNLRMPPQRYTFDSNEGTTTITSQGKTIKYHMTGMKQFAKTGQGTLVTTSLTPSPTGEEERAVMTLNGNEMTVDNAVRKGAGQPFQTRSHMVMRRMAQ